MDRVKSIQLIYKIQAGADNKKPIQSSRLLCHISSNAVKHEKCSWKVSRSGRGTEWPQNPSSY